MATTLRIESTVRGHHVYKAAWSPYIGEELPVQREVNNIHDDFAVAVLKNGNTVGHVPREISRVCWYFLHKSGSEMTCIVNGHKRVEKMTQTGAKKGVKKPTIEEIAHAKVVQYSVIHMYSVYDVSHVV